MSRILKLKPGPAPLLPEERWPEIEDFFEQNPYARVIDAAVKFRVSLRLMEKTLQRMRLQKREAQSAETDGPSSQRPVSGTTERTNEDTSSAKPGDSASNSNTHGNH